MASTSQCPYCGGTVRSDEKKCPQCGAENAWYVEDSPRLITHPKTIAELQEYCAERGMPLLRMRFFIGENYKKPKAFGIYQDGTKFVVYKNKADGSRAIRYNGRDEAYAVNELFQKLLDECHKRGIYPDRARNANKPVAPAAVGAVPVTRAAVGEETPSKPKKKGKQKKPGLLSRFFLWSIRTPKWADRFDIQGPLTAKGCLGASLVFLVSILRVILIYGVILGLIGISVSALVHRSDGYYRAPDSTVYYRDGGDWYYSDGVGGDALWYRTDDFPASDAKDYYLGEDWDSDWGETRFSSDSVWHDPNSSSGSDSYYDSGYDSGSSSDYSSWDSGDTDWSSDW